MLKVKNWIMDEKKHVRFYNDWNDKEVMMYVRMVCLEVFVVIFPNKWLLYGSVE